MAQNIDDYAIIMGTPIEVAEGIVVIPPTLNDIGNLPPVGYGHRTYQQYLSLFLLKQADILGVLSASGDTTLLSDMSMLDLLGALPETRDQFIAAVAFFVRQTVTWSHDTGFSINGVVLDDKKFDALRECICRVSGMSITKEEKQDEPKKFANKRAQMIWEKMQKGREAMAKRRAVNRDLLLPNIIGAVCAASNSYNLLNIGQLTVAQLYDQFHRIDNNIVLDISSHRWAAWGQESFPTEQWYKNLSTNK